MAITDREAARTLELYQELQQSPYKFDFYRALRALECAHHDYPRIGESLRPADDPVRFGQEPSSIFAPSSIVGFSPGEEGTKPRLTSLHFGLFGPNGPMPLHLTEFVRDRQKNSEDLTLTRFADLFHHRLFSLFYRAWANTQPAVSLDRPDEDRLANYIGATFGSGSATFASRDAMPDCAKRYFSGWLSGQTHSADGLKAILEEYLGLAVSVEQFIGHWMDIPPEGQLRLGETPETGALGTTSTIGAKVWDRQNKFRISVGPLNQHQYTDLLPGGQGLKRLISVVKNYIGDEMSWDLRFVLRKEEIVPMKLGGISTSDTEGRLGWTSWSKSDNPENIDTNDIVINPFAASH